MALGSDSNANWYTTMTIFKLDDYKSFPRTLFPPPAPKDMCFIVNQSLSSVPGNTANTAEPLEPAGRLNVHVIRN